MPKPFADRTGSGAHMHYHIADRNGENLFASDKDNRGMGLSKLAYQFLGGILKTCSGVMCDLVADGELL